MQLAPARVKTSDCARFAIMNTLRKNLSSASEIAQAAFRVSPLHNYAHLLAPGKWVAVLPKSTVWHHADAILPATLLGVGGKATESSSFTHRPVGAALPRWRVIALATLRVLMRLSGAGSGIVPDLGYRQGKATVLVRAKGRRSRVVALTPGDTVVRVGVPRSFDDSYAEARRRFARYVQSPQFSISDHEAVLTEHWCDGPLLSDLPLAERVRHASVLLERYADLVEAEAVIDRGSIWRHLPTFVANVALPAELAEALLDDRVRRLLDAGLLCPAQGDFGPENIILDPGVDRPTVVDFDSVGWHPVWLDPTKLALRTAGRVGFAHGMEPTLGDALDQVWAAAGLEGVRGLTASHCLLLVAIGQAWHKNAYRPADGGADASKFSKAVRREALMQLHMISRDEARKHAFG